MEAELILDAKDSCQPYSNKSSPVPNESNQTEKDILQVLADADISYVGMIKALLLIIKPPWAWEHIFHARRGVGFVLFIHLLPLLVLTGAANWYGLSHWGEMLRGPQRVRIFTPGQAAIFEMSHLILSLGVVFIGTWLIKALGETFHGRHRFGQTFRVVAYGLSPLFLLRLAEVHPAVNPWLAWAIGITLTIRVLYSGIPKIMEPDPPHAFGLFLMSSIFLLFITGLVRFITDWYLQGRFVRLQPFVDGLADKLPF